jgi:hypothetical protein
MYGTGIITVTEITVPDGGLTATEALPATSGRKHLMCKYEGSAFYVGYGNDLITGASAAAVKAQMTLVDSQYPGDFWDANGIPKQKVMFYQDLGGGNLTVKIREGV